MRPGLPAGCALFLAAACSDNALVPVTEVASPLVQPDREVDSGIAPLPGDACDSNSYVPALGANIDETCGLGVEVGPIEVEIAWSVEGFANFAKYDQVLAIPAVGPLFDGNGDGRVDGRDPPSIVTVADDGVGADEGHRGILRVLSGADGTVLTTFEKQDVDRITVQPYKYGSPALGDVDLDGDPEIVLPVLEVGSETGPPDTGAGDPPYEEPVRGADTPTNCTLAALTPEGEVVWETPLVEATQWCGGHAPALTDLEGDGDVEVILGATVFDGATGSVVATGEDGVGAFAAYPDAGYMSYPVDLDGDGIQEILAGRSVYRPDGTTWCETGDDDGFPGAADLDGDGEGEFVVVGNGVVRFYETDCTRTAEAEVVGGGNGGPPTLGDVDGDGRPEAVVAGSSAIAVYEADGSVRWSQPVEDPTSNAAGSTLFDFDGDGLPEIVYADETALRIFQGATGAVRLVDTFHTSRTLHEYPVVADVDADGEAEIVVPQGAGHGKGDRRGIYVLQAAAGTHWPPARRAWNQHAYQVTNVTDGLVVSGPRPVPWPSPNLLRAHPFAPAAWDAGPDLLPVLAGTCTLDCGAGTLRMVVEVANGGAAVAPGPIRGAVLDADGSTIDTFWVAEDLDPGESTIGIHLALPARAGLLTVVVDDHGRVAECNEDNNRLTVTEGLCAPTDIPARP